MKIRSWNTHCMGPKNKRGALRRKISLVIPDIVIIQESKLLVENVDKAMISIWPSTKGQYKAVDGNAGGLIF